MGREEVGPGEILMAIDSTVRRQGGAGRADRRDRGAIGVRRRGTESVRLGRRHRATMGCRRMDLGWRRNGVKRCGGVVR
jgi:hypothetical protein